MNISIDWDEIEKVSAQVQKDLIQSGINCCSEDSNVLSMWEKELNRFETSIPSFQNHFEWYTKANDFWDDEKKCTPDIQGVLGGFEYISPVDLIGSKKFITLLKKKYPLLEFEYALDCAAGIGRVTKELLIDYFEKIDILEQSPRLISVVPEYLKLYSKQVDKIICNGMQNFIPEYQKYDFMWIQWAIGHLTDVDMISFLKRCRKNMKKHAVICLKENILVDGNGFDIDKEDSSITRCDAYYKSIFKQAGLKIVLEMDQENFPEELYPVRMYALT